MLRVAEPDDSLRAACSARVTGFDGRLSTLLAQDKTARCLFRAGLAPGKWRTSANRWTHAQEKPARGLRTGVARNGRAETPSAVAPEEADRPLAG